MEVQGLAGLQPIEEAAGQEMETGQVGAEPEEMAEQQSAAQSEGFAEFLRKPESLPPHRTVSPGYSGDEVILDEVALISEKGEDVALAGDSGNHSSEEELEEINTNKSHYVERDCKRKWTDTSCDSDTEFEEPELGLEVRAGSGQDERSTSTSAGSFSCSTPVSGDDSEDHNHNQPAPVQFSTSPPVDVHKPRRSLSPPPKLFGLSQPGQQLSSVRQQEAADWRTGRLGSYSSSLGDLTRIDFDTKIERRASCKKTISPRKKSRTSRVHHIQRPCLDFEKMQQLRARAVSWRHGGELSLFCW